MTVHDASGSPISSAATVKLLRGTIPSAQGQTSRGSAELIVNNIGEFTVIVDAPGYKEAQKDISVLMNGNMHVDVYLQPSTATQMATGTPGGVILAPKAKGALGKALLALAADKNEEAEKQLTVAMKLAPGHPDVLYAQGVLRIKQHKWSEAQSALEKATQIDPSHGRAFAALGMALCDQGKYAEAIVPLEKSLEIDAAGTWETRWALAKAYYQCQRYEEAVNVSQAALAGSNGKEPKIALLVAQSLTATGRYEDAAQVLREFLNENEYGDRKETATARRWLENLAVNGKIQTAKN
ncbi:MAG TPA: tetratricopeptide repeat protein [Candidatus Dormibacteraeota bacterium]|nr:tetratricopeptide repeat protein [Candidatus Dormibacteraeota bacterium]